MEDTVESLKKRIEELEEELNSKVETDFNKLTENFKIEYNKSGIEGQMAFNQNVLGIFVTPFSNMVKDSPNYTEITCNLLEAGQPELIVTIQKKNGKTPHTLRKEAEAEIERLNKYVIAGYEEVEEGLKARIKELEEKYEQRSN